MSTMRTMYPGITNARSTTTLGEISDETTYATVADASVLPSVPCLATLGFDQESAETVLVTAKNGNVLTIQRGVSGSPLTWVAGTKICRVFSAKDLNDLQYNVQVLYERLQTRSATLSANGWNGTPLIQQTVITGLEVTDDVMISPDPACIDDYWEAGVFASSVVTGAIVFTAQRQPTSDLDIIILIRR